jgi:drug/metabolite transporter superfamily protein YnfA
MIYKNIHQIWLQGDPPGRFDDNITSLTRNHRDWTYHLWNEQSISKLINKYGSKYYRMWVDYPTLIQKCDAARHFILHAFGGLYVDMDIYFLKSVDGLITEECVLFYANPEDSEGHVAPGKLITNSIYYACKHNKFMNICINGLLLNKDKYKDDPNPGYTSFHTTAGGFITKMYEWYNKISNIHVHSHEHFELLLDKDRKLPLNNNDSILNKSTGIHMSIGDWYNKDI